MEKKLFEIYMNDLTLHCDKYLSYFAVYEEYFSSFRNKEFTFVEVGVQGGGSLEMWRKYFGDKARIIGIDVDPKVLERKADNVELFIGDQGDEDFWKETLPKIGDIDVFLDDGSHQVGHQMLTFVEVWPYIKNNGVYMCEDTHTSYFLDWGNGLYNNNTFLHFAKSLTDLVNKDHWQGPIHPETDFLVGKFKDIASIVFHNSMVTIRKGKPKWFRPNPYPNPLLGY
ncbi:class I SAM-dependent methyltransferase [bacterium]|nr:class I SAM-dependent methyltransferase [Actinomycetota bacterium]NDG32669.1 class I SAM-dependent methyltransferase [bacterium]